MIVTRRPRALEQWQVKHNTQYICGIMSAIGQVERTMSAAKWHGGIKT